MPALLLCACGQRGALYLPDEPRNVVVTPAQGATASPAPQASPATGTTAVPQASPLPQASPASPASPRPQAPTESDPDSPRRNNGTQRN
jgi:predicted small lipoprotein YifL